MINCKDNCVSSQSTKYDKKASRRFRSLLIRELQSTLSDNSDDDGDDDDYDVKVTVRNVEINNARYDKGIQVKYAVLGDDQMTESKMIKGTLKPQFDHSRLIVFSPVRQEHLEFFESGFITFLVYGRQVELEPDKRLKKMNTRVSYRASFVGCIERNRRTKVECLGS